jgi:hypothetical protein
LRPVKCEPDRNGHLQRCRHALQRKFNFLDGAAYPLGHSLGVFGQNVGHDHQKLLAADPRH